MPRRALLSFLAFLSLFGTGALHALEHGETAAVGLHPTSEVAHDGQLQAHSTDCGHPHEAHHPITDCLTCSVQRGHGTHATNEVVRAPAPDRGADALHFRGVDLPDDAHDGILGARGPPAVMA